MSRLALRRAAAPLALASLLLGCAEPTEPTTPANAEAVFGITEGVVGTSVATPPAVIVTNINGKPLPGVSVIFAVTAGGGSVTGASQTTDAEGVATVGGWGLGTAVGSNTMTATVAGLDPVTFTVTTVAGAPAGLTFVTPPSAAAQNRVTLTQQPVLQLQDSHGNDVTEADVTVTASIASGGGALIGTTSATTNASGIATFSDLAIQGTAGARTLRFAGTGLAPLDAGVTTSAGAAATIAVNAGDNQTALPNSAVATPPSVIVTDLDGNGVSGTPVTFAVGAGGGNATGTVATSNASGIATVGSWTLGASGSNTLTATSSGLTNSPVTFTATVSNLVVSSVTPATLTPGVAATINGAGFSATAGNNTVTIDGLTATVTAASTSQLTVTVPANLPCVAAHTGTVAVTVGGITANRTHPVRAPVQRSLTPGQFVVISDATARRCNELPDDDGSYFLSVYNTNAVYSTTPAEFELAGIVGTAGAGAGVTAGAPLAAAIPLSAKTARARMLATGPRRELAERRAARQHDERHYRLLESGRELLRRSRSALHSRAAGGAPLANPVALAVGDIVPVKVPNINSNFCTNSIAISGRVVYQGSKSIIIEDQANPLAGTIDSTYTQIGTEFDNTMFAILEANFGNPLASDPLTDNNGRIIMVFTNVVNTQFTGVAGYVVPSDLFPTSTCASSNVGEYFYAMVPTAAGNLNTAGSPPRWKWTMRSTIIHEVKHVTSVGERFARNADDFEESWLEETTARISEELYERQRYVFGQRANIGYGDAGNPQGPYCGVRLSCNQPRGIVRVFEDLNDQWYQAPEEYSPIGKLSDGDFSFYATGWSLVRWGLDASAASEATILKGMTQATTTTGIANFNANMSMTFAEALPRWTMAMAVDDHPSGSAFAGDVTQPSWNMRSVMSGLNADFPSVYLAWPLNPFARSFGSFGVLAGVRPGTAALIELSGAQNAPQILELRAQGSSAAAPSELKLAIVRIQ